MSLFSAGAMRGENNRQGQDRGYNFGNSGESWFNTKRIYVNFKSNKVLQGKGIIMKKLASMIILSVAIGLVIVGCKKSPERQAPQKKPAAPAKDERGVKAEQPAEQQTSQTQQNCPIMGGKINKSIFADFEGKRVYFCCPDCQEKFKAEPAKYVKQMEDAGVVLDKTPPAPAL